MDWIAAIILAIGIYFTGKYKWWGWAFSTIATLLWIWIGYKEEVYGMVALNIFLTFINTKNCIDWFKAQTDKKIVKNGNVWTVKNLKKKY